MILRRWLLQWMMGLTIGAAAVLMGTVNSSPVTATVGTGLIVLILVDMILRRRSERRRLEK